MAKFRKTEGSLELIAEGLANLPEPYPEDITDQVSLAIEKPPKWQTQYLGLGKEVGEMWKVNHAIGWYRAELNGLKGGDKTTAKSKLINLWC